MTLLNLSTLQLPTNRKFGYFFTSIFALVGCYFFYRNSVAMACVFLVISGIFFLVTIFKSELLLPLNKLWMGFGLILGMIVSPIVLGIIFFGLFTPIAIFMRLGGRDELRLNLCHKVSYWITRSEPIDSKSFKQQF